MPKFITAGTGLDAFAHCVEAFSSPHYHPMSQGIALEGMRLVIDYLPRAYADGTDLEARAHLMSAAAMGATAFQKGLGAIHALSHPVGAIFNTHHGTTNAVCMPAVLEFNAGEIAERFDNGLSGHRWWLQGLPKLRARLQRQLRDPAEKTSFGLDFCRNPYADQLGIRSMRPNWTEQAIIAGAIGAPDNEKTIARQKAKNQQEREMTTENNFSRRSVLKGATTMGAAALATPLYVKNALASSQHPDVVGLSAA
ncbi:NAD-dependent methanol dehydrogenase [Nymphon striatum]|nr:NAD-dependent methanol dehydrogenase [Nymphon striatum]